jgi:uncharacterized protein
MEQITQRKLLSGLCHGSIFFSSMIISIGIPIAIFLTNDDPVVKENAKESLNFHLNVFVGIIVFGLLAFVGIGLLLLGILWAFSLLMPLIAIFKVIEQPNQVYRYPFIFHVL